jgi:hypothetical protein
MWLSNDAPLLLERRLGRGRVCLWTSTLGIGWSSLAVRQSFIPALYDLTLGCARGRILARNAAPGEALVLPWPNGEPATLETPARTTQPLAPETWHNAHFLHLPGQPQPGVYRLSGTGGARDAVTVTGAPAEGDLRTLTAADQARLAEWLGSPLYPGWEAAVTALGPADAHRPLWPWLVLALLAIYLFETWFVRQL